MSASLIQFPAMDKGASLAGTCLMQTTIFTGVSFHQGPLNGMSGILSGAKELSFKQPRFLLPQNGTLNGYENQVARSLPACPALKNEGRVGATKSKGVGK